MYHTGMCKGAHHKGPRAAGNKSLISFRAGHGLAPSCPTSRLPAVCVSRHCRRDCLGCPGPSGREGPSLATQHIATRWEVHGERRERA